VGILTPTFWQWGVQLCTDPHFLVPCCYTWPVILNVKQQVSGDVRPGPLRSPREGREERRIDGRRVVASGRESRSGTEDLWQIATTDIYLWCLYKTVCLLMLVDNVDDLLYFEIIIVKWCHVIHTMRCRKQPTVSAMHVGHLSNRKAANVGYYKNIAVSRALAVHSYHSRTRSLCSRVTELRDVNLHHKWDVNQSINQLIFIVA